MQLNVKRFFSSGLKLFLNTQVMMLLVLMLITLYMGGFETVYKSHLKKSQGLDDQIQEKKKAYETVKAEADKLKQFENELKGIDTKIRELKPNEQIRIVAVSESQKIRDLAKGTGVSKIPPLPPPHDKLELIEFTPKKESITSVNSALNNVKTGGSAPPPPPSGSGDQDINLYRFDYEIKLKGTYPALVNFINQVIQSNNLVVVDKITIQKPDLSKLPPNASAPASPETSTSQVSSSQDPSSGISADGNTVILEMSLVLTLYFYDPANPTAAPKTS